MNAIIYECQPNAKRIKFHLPYKALEWRTKVKKIPSNWYHGNQKLWSVVNTVENMALLKKAKELPNVLSKSEILKVINAPKNIKHKRILYTIYSAGLRREEALNLRVEDIHSEEKYIFVKGGKGKKDRRTVLSTKLLQLLRAYFKKEKPSYWLFEGAAGGKYSVSSITKIFRRAVTDSKINPWATVHTLRHSFGTHLLQAGTNLRHIQHLMGHESSKTTEIYTHVMNVSVDRVMSPLDINEENDNLQR
jgi:site-specific recombinase XerD